MRKYRKYLVFIVFVFTVFIAGAFGLMWYFSETAAPSSDPQEVRFVIVKGSSAAKIAADLKEAGLIKSALAFKVYTQVNSVSDSIPPGQFNIPKNLKVEELVSLLRKGPTELWVTIPEGLRREQYPEIFNKALGLSGVEAQVFRQEFLSASTGFEGYLYPDTYLFPQDATGQQAVNLLKNTFNKKFAPREDKLKAIGLNLDEVVILASIIERETRSPGERATVAGIYFNRLGAGWPLQADATIQYATGDEKAWWNPPAAIQKEIDSRFNTYKYTGLPPAPIANPSVTSLEAVIDPETTDYWFYIHDSRGEIHFARTLEEHNQNIQKYLR